MGYLSIHCHLFIKAFILVIMNIRMFTLTAGYNGYTLLFELFHFWLFGTPSIFSCVPLKCPQHFGFYLFTFDYFLSGTTDTLVLSYTLSASFFESAISSQSSDSFYWRMLIKQRSGKNKNKTNKPRSGMRYFHCY